MIDHATFRQLMTYFPSGVTVVTARDHTGADVGLTISSFCSVSLVPPLVLVCVDEGSNTLAAISGSRAFTINFLAAGRERLADRFASKSDAKFAGVARTHSENGRGGAILSADSCAYLVCEVTQAIEAGDHVVFIGRVEEGALLDERASLLYGRRRYAAWDDRGVRGAETGVAVRG